MNLPITISEYPYSATVSKQGNLFRVSTSFIGIPMSPMNSFENYTEPMVLGRVLVLACGPDRALTMNGWNWHVGETCDIGWVTYKGRNLPYLPSKFISADFGYGLGSALLTVGEVLETRSQVEIVIAQMNAPIGMAG